MVDLFNVNAETQLLKQLLGHPDGIVDCRGTDHITRWGVLDTEDEEPAALVGDSDAVLIDLVLVEPGLGFLELEPLSLDVRSTPQVYLLRSHGQRRILPKDLGMAVASILPGRKLSGMPARLYTANVLRFELELSTFRQHSPQVTASSAKGKGCRSPL
jgi:hypothetical protein